MYEANLGTGCSTERRVSREYKHKHLGEFGGDRWRVSRDREFSISGGPGFISASMKTVRLNSGSLKNRIWWMSVSVEGNE